MRIRGSLLGKSVCFLATHIVCCWFYSTIGLAADSVDGDNAGFPLRVHNESLPNLIQLHRRVFSGGLPESANAFDELRRLGVRSIISVDGARPDVESANRHGLRYVHLPHGYDGISDTRMLELAKAVIELEGVVYIHCHHGLHRSPAAAVAALVTAGLVPPETATDTMRFAGTSSAYRGLYAAAERAKAVDPESLRNLDAEFPEVAKIPPLTESMVRLEKTFDNLKSLSMSNWQATPNHPDLDAAHQALLLREHYTELLRRREVNQKGGEFIRQMQSGESCARDLHDALVNRSSGRDNAPAQRKTLARLFSKISSNCTACHQEFRNVPR